ncbi:MAG: glycosyltransferase family 1 protein [Rubrobacter sp.]|nr:glycosyltransferase family 1 protein [Rubrobacter sp.]
MRIAFITETFLPATDGVVTRLRHTLEELDRMGDEALVVCPSYPEGGPDDYAGAFIHRAPGIPFPPYPQIRLAPPNPGIGRALRRFKPDVIHAVNPIFIGWAALFYSRKWNVPLVASYHTNVAAYASYYRLGFLYEAARWYTRTTHNMAAVNLCTSRATMDFLHLEGVKRVRLWPQGVDGEFLHPSKASREWRERLSGGNPGDKLLLFVGRLAPEKGIERLKHVLREMPEARLAIVGDGPARSFLEREYAGERAVFTGLLKGDELASAYASADAFLFPSTTETLGMAMIEALASGLPVVAARSGASHEVVTEGVDGFLYEPKDDGDFVRVVRRVFSEDCLRERLSAGARESAEGRDWWSSTRALKGYYEEAVGS